MNPLERQAIREIIHERDPYGDGRSFQATEQHLSKMVDGPKGQPFPNSFISYNTVSCSNNLGSTFLVCSRWYNRRLKGNVGAVELAWFNRWRDSSLLDSAGIFCISRSQGGP